VINEWDQREGESDQDWFARLQAIPRAGLDVDQLQTLALLQARARRRITGPTSALDSLKVAYRNLTPEERALFLSWAMQRTTQQVPGMNNLPSPPDGRRRKRKRG